MGAPQDAYKALMRTRAIVERVSFRPFVRPFHAGGNSASHARRAPPQNPLYDSSSRLFAGCLPCCEGWFARAAQNKTHCVATILSPKPPFFPRFDSQMARSNRVAVADLGDKDVGSGAGPPLAPLEGGGQEEGASLIQPVAPTESGPTDDSVQSVGAGGKDDALNLLSPMRMPATASQTATTPVSAPKPTPPLCTRPVSASSALHNVIQLLVTACALSHL
jgi:hypothetical protein